MFKFRFTSLAAAVCLLMIASGAFATSIPVANYSFETNPGFNNFCGGACEYSTGLPIPGWNSSGGATGQWITGGFAGNPNAFDQSVLAYSNGGAVWQDVATAAAGTIYTLQVEILHRTDLPMAGIAQLEVGGIPVSTATGTDMGPGTWSNWTATYAATAGDAGKTVTILLTSSGGQGDWDFARLDASNIAVPEPASMLLLASGAGLAAIRRRRSRS
jgi:hypothetical protein